MKPSVFQYHRPESTDEAVELLGSLGPDAKVLAGGQSLMPLLNLRLAAPESLIDITAIPELRETRRGTGTLRLGATTRHQDLERDAEIGACCPLLPQAAIYIGHPQIRTRGTLGGSLAHADPSAELPAVAVALDADMVVRSVRGDRRIAAADFFTFHLSTVLEEDELLVAVEFPVAGPRQGSAFGEVAARFGDFALAGSAAVLRLGEDGLVAEARIVCFAVAGTPVRLPEAEKLLHRQPVTTELLGEVEAAVARNLDPSPQLKASAGYKRRTAAVLARRAVDRAWSEATRRMS
ncbi:MAG TPA: xanthine dehydrogenase family protein subunit M [Trebonia sp.]|jgi:carbon-monoxide dehydrogenase medium subunit|nr:xanthine dehydrogenase family protein subunit M [Trebonia sp.]